MAQTLKGMFEQTVAKHGDKEGLVDLRLGIRWTYAEWDIEVNRAANALRASGVEKGDRVSTVLFNTSEFATTLFACMKIGAVFQPVNFRLSEREIRYILTDASPKVVLFERATASQVAPIAADMPAIEFWSIDEVEQEHAVNYHDRLASVTADRPLCQLDENDPYAIMYTSGTTGSPKGVIHSHRDMIDQALIMTACLRLTKEDRGLTVAPIFHCAELHCAFFPRVMIGAANVIMHHFEAQELIETVKQEQITCLFAAPTMWNMVLEEEFSAEDFQTLRQGLYGGAPMAPSLTKRLHDALGVELLQAYGMTEMGPAITALMDEEQIRKAGSAGRPLLNHDVRVVRTNEHGPAEPNEICKPFELGEIIVRGPSMMTAYYNRPEETEEVLYKGWYHTGDIGSFDEEGYLWVRDRVKDMILSGGENIYSREVEDVLFDHPGVLDAAVVGEPDEMWGERVVAFIVRKGDPVSSEELDAFCTSGGRLARFKRPRRYVFMEELPRNASGKLQKFKLREERTAMLE
ncbi:UNVERIFIED_CONTAM: fatty acid--CoA ligase [Halobacillus marinus]